MESYVIRDIIFLFLNLATFLVFSLTALYVVILVFSAILSIFVKRIRAVLSANRRIIVVMFVVLCGSAFLLVFFRLIYTRAFVKDEIDVDPVDQTCTRDSDCTSISIDCSCGYEMINKIHEEKYIEMKRELNRDVCQYGMVQACSAERGEYVCNNGICDEINENY